MRKILLPIIVLVNIVWSQSPTENSLYKPCAACHGSGGNVKAFQKSEIIAGQPFGVLTQKLKDYRSGKRDVAGMGAVMKTSTANLTDEQIVSLSVYISQMKK